mgnify:CR=1 FL=1
MTQNLKSFQRQLKKSLPQGMQPVYMGTTRKINSVVGNLVSFVYLSPTATVQNPLIIQVWRQGRTGKLFKFDGPETRTSFYMQGLLLTYLSDFWKAYMISKFGRRRYITYREMQIVSKLTKSNFRVYKSEYVRGAHIVNAEEFVRMQLGEDTEIEE